MVESESHDVQLLTYYRCGIEIVNQGGTKMLVLSRKIGSSIKIGDDIILTVVKVDRNQVRLGITAPKHVSILRDELTGNSDKQITMDVNMKELSGCR